MTRQNRLIVLVLVVLTLGTACGDTESGNTASGTQDLTKIDFIFSWKHSGHRSPYLLAEAKGFFEEEGLDVNLREGVGSDKTVDLLASGRVDLAEIEFPSLVVAVEQGRDLRTVATILQTSPQCIASWTDSGISAPKDLEGQKVVAVPGASDTQMMIGPLFGLNDVEEENVDIISADFNTRDQIFLSKEADAMPTFINDTFVRLQTEGLDVNCFLYADFGVDLIGNGLAASSSFIEEEPEIVAGFVRALLRAWEYAEGHPDEAIEVLAEVAPLLKAEEERPKLDATFPLTEGDSGLGYTDPERVEETAQLLLEAGLIDQVSDGEAYFTNEFLP